MRVRIKGYILSRFSPARLADSPNRVSRAHVNDQVPLANARAARPSALRLEGGVRQQVSNGDGRSLRRAAGFLRPSPGSRSAARNISGLDRSGLSVPICLFSTVFLMEVDRSSHRRFSARVPSAVAWRMAVGRLLGGETPAPRPGDWLSASSEAAPCATRALARFGMRIDAPALLSKMFC